MLGRILAEVFPEKSLGKGTVARSDVSVLVTVDIEGGFFIVELEVEVLLEGEEGFLSLGVVIKRALVSLRETALRTRLLSRGVGVRGGVGALDAVLAI